MSYCKADEPKCCIVRQTSLNVETVGHSGELNPKNLHGSLNDSETIVRVAKNLSEPLCVSKGTAV